jgi:hypothetical protein
VQPAPNGQTSSAYQYGASGQQISHPTPQADARSSQLKMYEANYASPPPAARTSSAASSAATYHPPMGSSSSAVVRTADYRTVSSTRQLSPARPEVENVIRSLRAMPPQAGQRALESGRYSNLSPAELQQVRIAAGLPPA